MIHREVSVATPGWYGPAFEIQPTTLTRCLLYDHRAPSNGGTGTERQSAIFIRPCQTVTIHTIPRLTFVHDESVTRGIEIDRLIEQANKSPSG